MNMERESKGLILAVDDNPENLGVLFEYLDLAGFSVLLVQNGENALMQAEDKQPDIILLDIMMPDLDGFEVCRRLKANETTKNIPVIFMTALSETVDKIKGFDVGGVDYITKPIQCKEVEARINAHLLIGKLQQALQEKNAVLEQYVALLAEKNTQLEEMNASKDRFFSIISHDLRSPFTGLLGIAEIITEKIETYTRKELKNKVMKLREISETLYALLENLLTWARIQRGLIEQDPREIDVQEIVALNVALFTANAEQKQITVSNAIPEQTIVYADHTMVDTVIRNLLSNALKFTPAGGRVDISATQAGSSVTVSIADTGIGIDAEYLPKLFRIDTNYKRAGTAGEQGTGLGLSLCQEFVERTGGKIWVESEVGKGTTFRFTLPQKPME